MNLVTGATGIIGSHVTLALLRQGQPVVACRRSGSDIGKTEKLFAYYGCEHLFERIKWTEIDITDIFSIEEAIPEQATVYHCAGLVSFSRKDKKKLFEVNEKGTRNVVNASIYKKASGLCHVSSLAAFHNLDHRTPIDETVFWKRSGKESDYAMSKYNAEREVWRGMEEGLPAVIVNPGVVLSPGFWDQSSSKLFDTCYKGNKFYPPGTTAYVSASDVASIMLELVSQRKFGNRYILVENNYSFQSIFNMVQKNFRKPLPYIKLSATLLKLGWAFDSLVLFLVGKRPILTKALVHSALNRQSFSNKKIKESLSFNFIPTASVIEQICAFYLQDRARQRNGG